MKKTPTPRKPLKPVITPTLSSSARLKKAGKAKLLKEGLDTKKRSALEAFNDAHAEDVAVAAARRAARDELRLRQIALEEKKHEAKVRKMELDAQNQQRQWEMMKMLLSSRGDVVNAGLVGGSAYPTPSIPNTMPIIPSLTPSSSSTGGSLLDELNMPMDEDFNHSI